MSKSLTLTNPKEFSKIHNEIEQRIFKKKRTCVYPGCNRPAIGSHNISKAILSTIAHKGHVRMFKVDPYKGFDLPSVGINNATRFRGFCSHHDAQLFQSIDHPQAKRDDAKNLLLLNYRANVQEELLKTYKIEFYSSVLQTFDNPNVYPFTFYRQRVHEIKMNLQVTKWYTSQLLDSINGFSNDFVFRKIELPFYEVAASELFGMEPADITAIKRNLFDNFGCLHPFATLFVHILPDPGRQNSCILLSAHKKDEELLSCFCDYLSGLGPSKALSDLLLLYLELWCCSEQFYQDYIRTKKEEITTLFAQTANQNAIQRQTGICLFN